MTARILCSSLVALYLLTPTGDDSDFFAFFQPTVLLSPVDRATLARGAPLVQFLPATGQEIAAFTATALRPTVTVDRAAAWLRQAELLRENRYVIASQRLSSPPRLSDFDRLAVDEDDLEEIRRCVPSRCGVKLAAADIETLTRVAAAGGSNWKPLLQQAFRQMLLRRALSFAAGGLAALDDIADKTRPSSPADAMRPLVEHSTFLADRVPGFAAELVGCAHPSRAKRESFMYWSQERLGGRPIITITNATLMTGDAGTRRPLLMIGVQVYASHYLDASLTVTAIVPDASASQPYFVYLHRSNVDLLGGFWGGVARSLIESRVRKDGPAILRSVGERLANSDPPAATTRHAGPAR